MSLSSPFKSQRAFPREKAVEIFTHASRLALAKVQDKEILEQIAEKDEILFIFDALLVDYAYLHYQVHSEEFKATVSKYGLSQDPKLQSHIT